ncbi:hypothetical protein Leryth_025874 [Lithospermum erythrorhizon]|uniref:Uncharacterized protein n=1 Tax=Lithospermum erythrorhizon TaxID=34254 RepID=A0AAV3QCL5_LITER|nr:hypothetical protein Leryth_025874 [Lithospermum erythrorhizon]
MASSCPGNGRKMWPELVGMHGQEAARMIETQNKMVKAIIVDKDALLILNFDCNRVWVKVDKSGIVAVIPQLG